MEEMNKKQDKKGLQAVLSVNIRKPDGSSENKRLLFDTEKATEVCDVINAFGYAVQTIFLSPGGWLFLRDNNRDKLEVGDQKTIKDYIGENYPERYAEIFGKVEEA